MSHSPLVAHINAVTISDAWFQAVYQTMNSGRNVTIDKGSFEHEQERKELDFVSILISRPSEEPMLPIFPENCNIPNAFSREYADKYTAEYIFSADKKSDEEQYSYGKRIFEGLLFTVSGIISQIDYIARSLKAGELHSNQHIIQISERTDLFFEHPPCLRHIDIKIIDGAICFYPYFRSWDLWSAFATNLYGIEMLKQYMAIETGLENGFILASSKSLHIYSSMWDYAAQRCGL